MLIVKPGHVLCLVCDGTKVSPSTPALECLCCKGEGQLTKERFDQLENIRVALGRKILDDAYVSWQ